MNLDDLRDEIKSLQIGKSMCADCKLAGIKETVKAVDEFMVFVHHRDTTTFVDLTNIPIWKEIKELLRTHKEGRK